MSIKKETPAASNDGEQGQEEVLKNDGRPSSSDKDTKFYEDQLAQLKGQLEGKSKEAESLKVALKQEREKRRNNVVDDNEEEPADERPNIDPQSVIAEAVAQAKKVVEEESVKFRSGMVADLFEEELNSLSANEKERELIKEHYQRTIRPSGFSRAQIKKDLLLCKAAANLPRLQMQSNVDSLTSSLSSKGAGQQANAHDAAASLSNDDLKLLRKFGLTPEDYYKMNKKS